MGGSGEPLDIVRTFAEGVPTCDPTVDQRITTVWLAVATESGADLLRWSGRRLAP